MNPPPSVPDLRARARHAIRAALAGGRALTVAELPRAWPLTRAVVGAVARRMADEGDLVRVGTGAGGGPPRYTLPDR